MGIPSSSNTRKIILIDPPAGGSPYLLYDDGKDTHRVSVHGNRLSRYITVGCTVVDMDAVRFILKKIGLDLS